MGKEKEEKEKEKTAGDAGQPRDEDIYIIASETMCDLVGWRSRLTVVLGIVFRGEIQLTFGLGDWEARED